MEKEKMTSEIQRALMTMEKRNPSHRYVQSPEELSQRYGRERKMERIFNNLYTSDLENRRNIRKNQFWSMIPNSHGCYHTLETKQIADDPVASKIQTIYNFFDDIVEHSIHGNKFGLAEGNWHYRIADGWMRKHNQFVRIRDRSQELLERFNNRTITEQEYNHIANSSKWKLKREWGKKNESRIE